MLVFSSCTVLASWLCGRFDAGERSSDVQQGRAARGQPVTKLSWFPICLLRDISGLELGSGSLSLNSPPVGKTEPSGESLGLPLSRGPWDRKGGSRFGPCLPSLLGPVLPGQFPSDKQH